jgi:hypothetical protein
MPNKRTGERAGASPKQPAVLNESLEFMRGMRAKMREDAATGSFKYHPRDPDTRNPRPTARRIKRAIESPETPHDNWLKIRDRVFITVLCAGNMLSCDAPLEAQYLAACQRLTDSNAGQMLHTPEEFDRHMALIHASNLVQDALDELDAIRKGGHK